MEREFTLGNLYEIWEKTLGNTTKLFDTNLNETGSIVSAYVNGVKVPSSIDFRSIGIKADDEIALVFGPMRADKIPSAYQFPEGL